MRKSWSTVSNGPGALLCRISCSVAGLIPGERTSATPRSVLQISDRHLRRYPILNEHRHLGLILSSDLRWSAYIDKILSKAGRLLYTIIRLRHTISRKALILYYSLYIRPVVEYASIAWPKLSAHLRNRLERFQRRAFKVILRKPLFESSDHDEVLLTLQQPSLESRRQSAILGFQLANKTASHHLLNECFPPCKSGPLPPPAQSLPTADTTHNSLSVISNLFRCTHV